MNNIAVVFEHKDFLVVNKPPGVSFQDQIEAHINNSDDKTRISTCPTHLGLVSRLEKQLDCPLWPVHRLDKITSGLVIFARHSEAAARFGKIFEQKLIGKTYLAISNSKPKKKQGKIVGDMKKSRNGCWLLSRTNINPAVTQFESWPLDCQIENGPIENSPIKNRVATPAKLRVFKIRPKTGKTHQIRVALKSIGSAILGDTRYGAQGSDRGYLHASQLEFEWDNQNILIKAAPTSGQYFLCDAFTDWFKAHMA